MPLRAGARKLAERFTGPFTITGRVTSEAWRLELPASLRIHPVFHSSQLKPVQGQPRQRQPIQLDQGPEEDQEYEVERLLDRRTVRGREEFLMRRHGYSAFDDTWEPRANLANA